MILHRVWHSAMSPKYKCSHRTGVFAACRKDMAEAMVKQLSIFVENQKGRLAAIVDLLSSYDINMYALSVGDTADFGILRLIVDDNDKAISILKEHNVIATLTEVVVAVMPNEPGGLAKVLWILAGANINVEYLYAFVSTTKSQAYVALRVEDNAAASKILSDNEIPMVDQKELEKQV